MFSLKLLSCPPHHIFSGKKKPQPIPAAYSRIYRRYPAPLPHLGYSEQPEKMNILRVAHV